MVFYSFNKRCKCNALVEIKKLFLPFFAFLFLVFKRGAFNTLFLLDLKD